VQLLLIGDRREAYHLPRLLRQHVTGEIVPRVTPEGMLSGGRCIINTIAPLCWSLSPP
jgi:hypothetical protein